MTPDEHPDQQPAQHPGPVVGFDLDMTLVDSAPGIVATLQAALVALGVSPPPGHEQVWPFVGLPLEDTVRALAPQVDVTAAVTAYRARYATTGVPLTRLLPGATEALYAVRAVSGRVLVVSAKAQAGVHEVLEAVGLGVGGESAPDLVVGGLFAGAKGVRLAAEAAEIYVGDHPGDIEAARVAGAVAVAVATGPIGAAQLRAAGADVVLDDLLAFPDWLSGHLAAGSAGRIGIKRN